MSARRGVGESTRGERQGLTDFARSAISIDIDELIEYIGNHYDIDHVFSDDELAAWAENNGYVKAQR